MIKNIQGVPNNILIITDIDQESSNDIVVETEGTELPIMKMDTIDRTKTSINVSVYSEHKIIGVKNVTDISKHQFILVNGKQERTVKFNYLITS